MISLARRSLRARWLRSTGLSGLDSVWRSAKWRTSGFGSCGRYPGPRYGRPSTGQRVVRISLSWPTSWRNGVASLFPTNPRIGSPPCKRSILDRPEHRPGHRPHRHELVDGVCERRTGHDNGLRVRRAPPRFLENPSDRLAGQLLGQVGERPWPRRPRPVTAICQGPATGNNRAIYAAPCGWRWGQQRADPSH